MKTSLRRLTPYLFAAFFSLSIESSSVAQVDPGPGPSGSITLARASQHDLIEIDCGTSAEVDSTFPLPSGALVFIVTGSLHIQGQDIDEQIEICSAYCENEFCPASNPEEDGELQNYECRSCPDASSKRCKRTVEVLDWGQSPPSSPTCFPDFHGFETPNCTCQALHIFNNAKAKVTCAEC